MKTTVTLALVLMFVGCNLRHGNKNEPASAKRDENHQRLEVNEEIHNFGTLKAGEIVVYSFQFENNGGNKLAIKKIDSGCSCLEIKADKMSLNPGETGNLKVIFNTAGLHGEQFQPVRILTEDEGIFLDLAVTANVINEQIQFNN